MDGFPICAVLMQNHIEIWFRQVDNFRFAELLSECKSGNHMREYVLYFKFYAAGTLFRKGKNIFTEREYN